METNTNEEVEIDLLELYYLIKSKILLIVVSGIILAAASGLVSSFLLTPIYTSKSKLYILSMSTSLTSLADLQIGTQLTQDYMVLVKSRPVVTTVINNLELDTTYEALVDCVTITNPSSTRILEIAVDYPDPYLAKRIVDEFASVSRTSIASIMDSEEPTLIEEGHIPEHPSSPNTKRNALIGLVLGIVLATGVIVVLYILDDTIKDATDVEKYLAITTLGLIPVEEGTSKLIELDKKKRRKNLRRQGMKEKR